MNSIGDTLRRERQRRNLDLHRISSELKISVRFLEAMEQDDFGKLPGGVFTKSFVRQYASFLGIETDELIAEVSHAVEPEPDVGQLSDKQKPDIPVIELEVGDESWHSVRDRAPSVPSSVKAGALFLLLTLGCSGAYYWWWQRPHRQASAHVTLPPAAKTASIAQALPPAPQPAANPPANAPQSPTAAVAATTVAPTTAAPAVTTTPSPTDPNAKPAATDAAATPTPTPTPAPKPDVPVIPPNPNATVRVAITADEPVWIRADVNGKFQFSGTLQAHESRNIDVDGQLTLRLGNAGGATVTLNGKPVGPIGPKGQIRIVQLTSGGFQIVSVPKLVDPLDRF
jgi:cytoskeleton protein RodZ